MCVCVFIQTYAPSVFEKYMTTVKHGGKEIQLNLYDTAGMHTNTHIHTFHSFYRIP